MTLLKLADVLAGTSGTLRGQLAESTVFTRIERDSRQVDSGCLFIAIRGERLEGHDFVDDAAANGATAALVSRRWADAQAESPLPLIVVDEPVAALQRLARYRRASLDVKVVGVTGSVGKTSAKEAIARVLEGGFTTYRNPGNLNSEIGLPLSLLEIPDGTEVAVLEMGGAYAAGELALLAEIAQPAVGVVTNVYPVHLERMGSIEAIAETKAELITALDPDGIAVLNGDDPRVLAMGGRCKGRVLTFGLGAENDVRADSVTTAGLNGTSFWLTLAKERLFIKVPIVGGHAVQIALIAIATGHALGMHISEMLGGLKDPGIQVRLLFLPGPNGSRLIDDTYNASTPSVLSALGLLREIAPRRAIAVLGDMRELGELSEAEHRIIGRRAAEVADLVVTYGELALTIATEARSGGDGGGVDGPRADVQSFGTGQRQELVAYLRGELREGDVVLLKGSRGLMMEEFVAALRVDGAAGSLPRDGQAPTGDS